MEILEHTMQQKRYSQPPPPIYIHNHRHPSQTLTIPTRQSFSSIDNNYSATPRLSITNSEIFDMEMDHRSGTHLSRSDAPTRQSIRSNKSIKSTSSQNSLSRSKSMTTLRATPIKHSPNCKSNLNKF